MKRYGKSMLCALLALLLLVVPMFSGCQFLLQRPAVNDEPTIGDGGDDVDGEDLPKDFDSLSDREKAFWLWNNLEETTDSISETLQSYTVGMTVSARGEVQGMPLVVSGGGTLRAVRTDDEVFYYEETTEHMEMGNGQYKQDVVLKSGFVDGKMFSYQSTDGEGRGVYSEIAAADWMAHMKEKNKDSVLTLSEKTVQDVTLTTSEDGYEAKFSSFTQEGLAEVKRAYGSLESLMGTAPSDVEITIATTAEKLPLRMKICFVYDENADGDAPEMIIEGTYTDLNQTEPVSVSLDGYTKVSDLRVVERADRALDRLKKASAATFLCTEACTVYQGTREIADSSATIDISFFDDVEGYRFVVEDSLGTKIRYEKGKQYIQQQGLSMQEVACTEFAARSTIEQQYIGFAKLSAYNTAQIMEEGDGKYVVYLVDVNLDVAAFASILKALSATEKNVKNAQANVALEFEDGELKSLTYSAFFDIVVSQGTCSVTYYKDMKNISYTK